MRKNSRLPNFHNLGIHLRMLLIVNLLATMAAILLSKQLSEFLPLLAQLSALVQPILLLSMLGLYTLYPLLNNECKLFVVPRRRLAVWHESIAGSD